MSLNPYAKYLGTADPYQTISFTARKLTDLIKGLDAASALAVFTSLRDWNCKLIATVPAEAYAKPLTHPERGEMFFRTLVETMGGHDLNHVQQIEGLVA